MNKPNRNPKTLAMPKHTSLISTGVALFLAACSLSACQKDSEVNIKHIKQKQTVVDYILDLENLYMIKYSFQYNDQYQVTKIYRGERHANISQLQLIAEAHYDSNNKSNLPDSLSTYNTRGFKVGVILAKDYNSVAKANNKQYQWPERNNKLLTVPGGELALAIAGKKIGWSGSGHMGSGSTIEIMDHLKFLNRSSLKDSIQIPVSSKTDGTNRKFDDFHVKYNKLGFPIDMAMYDAVNADFEQVKINYRDE